MTLLETVGATIIGTKPPFVAIQWNGEKYWARKELADIAGDPPMNYSRLDQQIVLETFPDGDTSAESQFRGLLIDYGVSEEDFNG